MRTLEISIAKRRTSKQWQVTPTTWESLVKRLEAPVVTQETEAEWESATKAKKAKIKDVGGFVGGVVVNGKRINSNIKSRDVLTLDLDSPSDVLMKNFTDASPFECVIHQTHSHRTHTPRLRLIAPLSRTVTPDEYQAIGKAVAAELGQAQFDPTTYQPARLMYFPSISVDTEKYVFLHLKGDWVDADAYLAKVGDWQDLKRENFGSSEVGRLQDPRTKTGLIGAYCRTYALEEVLDGVLSHIYSEGAMGRYTYINGTSANGLALYDGGLYAYSYHATDPANTGHCLNAFDLVRIQLFGEMDIDYKGRENTLPSLIAMNNMVMLDSKVQDELNSYLATEEEQPTGLEAEDGKRSKDSWMARLTRTQSGLIEGTTQNLVRILENAPIFKGRLRQNDFRAAYEIHKPLPWRKFKAGEVKRWTDADESNLKAFIESHGVFRDNKVKDALNIIFDRHSYHPVVEYLDGLKWDGVERLDNVIDDYLGVLEPSEYSRAITRKTFVAAVKRIYEPGCKFDYVLTLQGAQGIGKSAFFRKMSKGWLQESIASLDSDKAAEQLRGYWIVELGELKSVKKAALESVKSFITTQVDSYRKAYGHHVADYFRQNIFVASTNEDLFIRDDTGGRRWWVLRCSKKPKLKGGWQSLNDATVDQLWAEAKMRYEEGELVYLDDELEEVAREIQQGAQDASEKVGLIADYLDIPIPPDFDRQTLEERQQYYKWNAHKDRTDTVQRTVVCGIEIWCECFGGDRGKLDYRTRNEIATVMAHMKGWSRYRGSKTGAARRGVYGMQISYQRDVLISLG